VRPSDVPACPAPAPEAPQILTAFERFLRSLVREEVSKVLRETLPTNLKEAAPDPEPVGASGSSPAFIRLSEAAERVRRSPRTLWRWRQDGLRTYGPNNDLIDPRELDEFVRLHRKRPPRIISDEEHAAFIMNRRRSRKAG